jgi:hypothetical protein
MMTTLALIAGMIPVAIGAARGDSARRSGRGDRRTITSTFLTLFVIRRSTRSSTSGAPSRGALPSRTASRFRRDGDAVPEPRATENGNAA